MLYYFSGKLVCLVTISLLSYGLFKDYGNAIILFIYFEVLILLGSALLLVESSLYGSLSGFILFIEVIALAAIKAAIGLSIVVSWVRYKGTLNFLK